MSVKKYLLVLVCLSSVFLLTGCTKSKFPTPRATKLAPADLTMRLDIEELPVGVVDSDIGIHTLGPEELPLNVNGAYIQGWSFSPDGLEFTHPASMTIEVATGSLPYVFHIGEKGVSLIDKVWIDIQENKQVVNVPINGFSAFVLVNPAEQKLSFSQKVGEGVLGEKITLRLQVELSAPEFTLHPGTLLENTYYIRPLSKTIKGFVNKNPDLDTYPGRDAIGNALFGKTESILGGYGSNLEKTIFNDQYTIITEGFTCDRVGTAFVEYILDIQSVANSIQENSLGDYLQLDKLYGNMTWANKVRVQGEVVCHPKPIIAPNPKCGNYIIEAGEQCDRFSLNNQTCETLGYAGGKLSCDAECQFDYRSCVVSQNYSCAENVWEGNNLFRASYDICQDDCPIGESCNPRSCTCMIDVAKTKIDMSIISLPVEPPLITHTVPGRDFSQRSLAPTKGSSPTKEVEKENILPKVNGDDPTPSEGGKEVNTEMNTVGHKEGESIEVINYNGQYISVNDIVRCDGSECNNQEHRHVLTSSLTDISGIPVKLPEGGACGVSLGTTKETPVEVVGKILF